MVVLVFVSCPDLMKQEEEKRNEGENTQSVEVSVLQAAAVTERNCWENYGGLEAFCAHKPECRPAFTGPEVGGSHRPTPQKQAQHSSFQPNTIFHLVLTFIH